MSDVEALNPVDPSGQNSTSPPKGATDQEPEKPPEISYDLAVSEDNLKAYLRANVKGSPSISIEDLKKFLKTKRIYFGLVDDRKIGEYISQGAILQEPCLVTEGQPATPGKDAQVTYSFDRDPSKSEAFGKEERLISKIREKSPRQKKAIFWGKRSPWSKKSPARMFLAN